MAAVEGLDIDVWRHCSIASPRSWWEVVWGRMLSSVCPGFSIRFLYKSFCWSNLGRRTPQMDYDETKIDFTMGALRHLLPTARKRCSGGQANAVSLLATSVYTIYSPWSFSLLTQLLSAPDPPTRVFSSFGGLERSTWNS